MNRSQLKGNLNTKINISILKDKLSAKKVLFLGSADIFQKLPDAVNLNHFFDVVISDSSDVLDNVSVDIYLDRRETPYDNGVLNLDFYEENKDTIFLVNDKFASILNTISKDIENYSIIYTNSRTGEITSDPHIVRTIPYGLEDNIKHLLNICNSGTLFHIADTKSDSFHNLQKYLTEKNKYGALVNLTNANRKALIYNW